MRAVGLVLVALAVCQAAPVADKALVPPAEVSPMDLQQTPAESGAIPTPAETEGTPATASKVATQDDSATATPGTGATETATTSEATTSDEPVADPEPVVKSTVADTATGTATTDAATAIKADTATGTATTDAATATKAATTTETASTETATVATPAAAQSDAAETEPAPAEEAPAKTELLATAAKSKAKSKSKSKSKFTPMPPMTGPENPEDRVKVGCTLEAKAAGWVTIDWEEPDKTPRQTCAKIGSQILNSSKTEQIKLNARRAHNWCANNAPYNMTGYLSFAWAEEETAAMRANPDLGMKTDTAYWVGLYENSTKYIHMAIAELQEQQKSGNFSKTDEEYEWEEMFLELLLHPQNAEWRWVVDGGKLQDIGAHRWYGIPNPIDVDPDVHQPDAHRPLDSNRCVTMGHKKESRRGHTLGGPAADPYFFNTHCFDENKFVCEATNQPLPEGYPFMDVAFDSAPGLGVSMVAAVAFLMQALLLRN